MSNEHEAGAQGPVHDAWLVSKITFVFLCWHKRSSIPGLSSVQVQFAVASCPCSCASTMGSIHHPVWKICLGQLSGNLQEAAELADVLQEVSAHIQVLIGSMAHTPSCNSARQSLLSIKEPEKLSKLILSCRSQA